MIKSEEIKNKFWHENNLFFSVKILSINTISLILMYKQHSSETSVSHS